MGVGEIQEKIKNNISSAKRKKVKKNKTNLIAPFY
jgi:hypothetical protein